jgi:hypothetical protein
MNDVQLASQQQQPTVSLFIEMPVEMHKALLLFLDSNPTMSQDSVIAKGLIAAGVVNREMAG